MFQKKRRWHMIPGQPKTELDEKIMYWESKGKLVPTRDMVRTPEQIEGIRKAGAVNTGCLDAVANAIHVGMNTQEIDDICMAYCKEHNANPSCLNYEGFPKSVCTSINEVVCHGIPKKEDVLQPGDIVFFAGTFGSGGISHVGIYVGNGQFIHAPNSRSVVSYADLNSSYYTSHYYGACRFSN